MDVDGFWALIDRSHDVASKRRRGSLVRRQARALSKRLATLPNGDLIAFQRHKRTQVALAYDWRLWAAGYLVSEGMSDDSFLDFRFWLVSQGRETFERVRADPDSLAGLAWSDDGEDFGDAENLAYLVVDILEKRGVDLKGPPGEDAPSFDPSEPTGEPFSEDDDEWFEATFPRLWARTESIRAVVGEVDYDPDVSEMSRGDLSGGHYTGLMVRSSLDPNVLARFRAGGHKVLCWMPRDGEIDSAELLPLAEELKALTFLAPECRDDSVLASLTGLRMLESRTSADNALDLSGLGELYDLRINDRPGLAGLDQVPLYFLSLTDTRRALAEFEGMAGLRELVVDGAQDARIDLGAHLPQLEVLVIDAPRIGSLADPGSRQSRVSAGQQQFDRSVWVAGVMSGRCGDAGFPGQA